MTTAVPFTLDTSLLIYRPISSFYSQTTPITNTIGNWNSGDIVGTTTLQYIIENILNKYQEPVFDAFEIMNQAETLTLGEAINGGAGSALFTWNSTNDSNVATDSIEIIDVTNNNTVLGTGLANNNSEPLNIPVTKEPFVGFVSDLQVHSYKITGVNSEGATFEREVEYNWKPRQVYFADPTNLLPLNDTILQELLTELHLHKAGSQIHVNRR